VVLLGANSVAAKAGGGAAAPATYHRGSPTMTMANRGPTPACMEGFSSEVPGGVLRRSS
jgi:hypothetical protein